MSLPILFSGSVLGFSCEAFGCFWVSAVDNGAVAGVAVLGSVGCLAALGANDPLPPVPASAFCAGGCVGLGPC